MAEEFPAIASPLHLGPEGRGATLKNRIVFSPTTFGLPHDAYVRRIAGIARGGCAMVVIGDVPVRRHERASLFSRKGAAEYRDLVEAIHAGGALAAAQLHESDSDFKALIPYVPGVLMKKISMMELRHILNEKAKELVTNMPVRKVRAITAAFGPAAVRARELGFDVMQIHGDRMVGSFSSALMSSREDEYGGSPERRTRFAVEAVRAVREAVPEMAIDYKLAVRQEDPRYGQAGVLLEELPVFVPLLEEAGVSSFSVALANHGSLEDTIPPRKHPYFGSEGCFLRYADEVRKLTKLPVSGVGSLGTPSFVEEQIASGRIDFALMSRQLLADPEWPNKVLNGRAGEVRRCVRCNKDCLGGMQRHEGTHCVFDAKTGAAG